MTTCVVIREGNELLLNSVCHCGLFMLIDQLLSAKTTRQLQMASTLLANLSHYSITVKPLDRHSAMDFIHRIIAMAGQMIDNDNVENNLLKESALELLEAIEKLEMDRKIDYQHFSKCWEHFSKLYYEMKLSELKRY